MKNRDFSLFTIAIMAAVILACDFLPHNPISTPAVINRVIDANAIHLTEKEVGHCKALVPDGWSFASIPPYVGADLFSPDGSSHAAWGITSLYKALYPSAQSALTYLLGAVGYKNAFFESESTDIGYGFMSTMFTSSIGRQGQVIYKIYDMDPTFYVISVYLGATTNASWKVNGSQALSAAISIRCVSQRRPSTVISDSDLDSSDPSNRADNPEVDLSEKWSEAILGYENVYSPTTGEHYLAPLNSYWEGGPDGGGYYRELPGGGSEKLEYGFGDY